MPSLPEWMECLLVDCPLEESERFKVLARRGLRRILLAAPTTAQARLRALCDQAAGFLYYVSFAGITGANQLDLDSVRDASKTIKAQTRTPVAVGFGVRDAQTAVAIAAFADAVVIGSALVERLAGAVSAEMACARASAFLVPIRAALDDAARDHAA